MRPVSVRRLIIRREIRTAERLCEELVGIAKETKHNTHVCERCDGGLEERLTEGRNTMSVTPRKVTGLFAVRVQTMKQLRKRRNRVGTATYQEC